MKTRKKKVNPKWFRHEALHTTNLCVEIVHDHLVDHHYYNSNINPKYNRLVDHALDALFAAYQAINEESEVKKRIKNPFKE